MFLQRGGGQVEHSGTGWKTVENFHKKRLEKFRKTVKNPRKNLFGFFWIFRIFCINRGEGRIT